MDLSLFHTPGMTIALALMLGMVAQSVAHHMRIPGIVLLLATGVALGPDGLGIVRPESLEGALTILTGFAVAVILFEGGLNLRFQALREAQLIIRQLILFGALFTIAGGAMAAHYILGWPWETSILFGTLVMVTGPTVINPLLKRIKVRQTVATVLAAEGVLIDAVGAVVATVALEAVLSAGHGGLLVWGWHAVSRLGFGMLAGAGAAIVLIMLFRVRRLIPEGTENVFTLAAVLALFQVSNAVLPESGIAAVIAAGIVVGNFSSRPLKALAEFKEELTTLFIGMLFILLAADVQLARVMGLGLPGLLIVVLLIVVVRPAAVFTATARSALNWKERLFIAWIGPRGIVAAAIASFFAASFIERDIEGGRELRALVFMVIAVTVVVAGLTGGWLAGVLGLRRPAGDGWVVLSANMLARALARLLRHDGQTVVLIDTNAEHCRAAAIHCTEVIHGNGLEAEFRQQAGIETRHGAVALTANDEVNYVFLQRVKEDARTLELYSSLNSVDNALSDQMLHQIGARLLFGSSIAIETWNNRISSGQVNVQLWRYSGSSAADNADRTPSEGYSGDGLLIVALQRNGRLTLIADDTRLRKGDAVYFFIHEPQTADAGLYLDLTGWEPAGPPAPAIPAAVAETAE